MEAPSHERSHINSEVSISNGNIGCTCSRSSGPSIVLLKMRLE